MLPGFTDLQCKGLCCNVSPSFPLGFKGGRLSFLPLRVVSAIRLFTWWLSVPANSISFFCGCTDLHKLSLSAAPNKLKFAPPPLFFFLTTGLFFSWRHVWTLKLSTVQGHCITTISSIAAGLAGWSDEFNCRKSFLRTRQTQHNSRDDTVVEIWSARPPQLYFKNNHSFLCKSFLQCNCSTAPFLPALSLDDTKVQNCHLPPRVSRPSCIDCWVWQVVMGLECYAQITWKHNGKKKKRKEKRTHCGFDFWLCLVGDNC